MNKLPLALLAGLAFNSYATGPQIVPEYPGTIPVYIGAKQKSYTNQIKTTSWDHYELTTPLVPMRDTFKLHSKPDAKKTVYLDLDGHVEDISGHKASERGEAIVVKPFDADGSPDTFNVDEKIRIQYWWLIMAEAMAPFDIDVTTEYPGEDAIRRDSGSDRYYGTRIACGNSVEGNSGGADFGNALLSGQDHSPTYAGNGCSSMIHEFAHTIGGYHPENYAGQHEEGIETIKGKKGVGETRYAFNWKNNLRRYNSWTINDLTNIRNNSIDFRKDDHGDSILNATDVVWNKSRSGFRQGGLISENVDLDVFKFRLNKVHLLRVNIDPSKLAGNLDIQASLLDSNGEIIVSSNPVTHRDAILEKRLSAGVYYIAVRNTGRKADENHLGYPDFTALGHFTLFAELTPVSKALKQVTDDFYIVGKNARKLVRPWSNDSIKAEDIAFVEYAGSGLGARLTATSRILKIDGPGVAGSDSIAYTLTTKDGRTGSGTINIQFVDSSKAHAVSDNVNVAAGNSVSFSPLWNDKSSEGGLRLDWVSRPEFGAIEKASDKLVYKAAPNFQGEDSVTYRVVSKSGVKSEAEVVFSVHDANGLLVQSDYRKTIEGHAVPVDLLVNDSSTVGQLKVTDIGSAENGSIELAIDGQLHYRPKDGFIGREVISYQVTDGVSYADGEVTIDVVKYSWSGDKPLPEDDTVTTVMGKPVVVNVRQNDSTLTGDAYDIRISSYRGYGQGSHGKVTMQVDGETLVYQPEPGFFGLDSFGYNSSVADYASIREPAQVYVLIKEIGGPEADSWKIRDVDSLDSTVLADSGQNTVLIGSYESDALRGSTGNDWLLGQQGADRMTGGSGDDWVSAGKGDDRLFGNHGNDLLFGGSGNDLISGGNGNDVLDAGTGNDILNGGKGDDTYKITKGRYADLIQDKGGNDTLVLDKGISFSDIINSEMKGKHLKLILRAGQSITIKNWTDQGSIEWLQTVDGAKIPLQNIL
ncbi:hypothetical protein EOPP23_15495 [Endozoicomonas sp. OPT23]|uniref:Ig-like domain-containing protein n=1 Tax=Endozoicomonas sp. OPT23 TaxID=2072845 RepID=UPI00129B076B|nr:Ig-like domain-containing protein [Endozoicomonas sp. OPT23]MRI34393.1 hypothetical protein [Endozoicomonas sp. OPT23]